MQATSCFTDSSASFTRYDAVMRKSDMSRNRPALSQRLVELRHNTGLTQKQLAAKLGLHPSVIAFWEIKGTPPRGEILPSLAKALGVSVDEILGVEPIKPKRQAAKGKLQQLFEAASLMPRRQQQKIISVLEPFISVHGGQKAA